MAAFEVDGDRIARQTLYFDRLEMVKRLGSDAKHIAIARGIYEAYGRRDMKAILDALDDNVTWGIDSVATEVPAYGILRGKQNVPRFFAAWAELGEFTKFEASDFVAAGDHVMNTLSYELVVKATGKRVSHTSPQQWTFANGKIIRWRGYEDTAATRDALRR
jgi:ketosteroid isomerase-like protein